MIIQSALLFALLVSGQVDADKDATTTEVGESAPPAAAPPADAGDAPAEPAPAEGPVVVPHTEPVRPTMRDELPLARIAPVEAAPAALTDNPTRPQVAVVEFEPRGVPRALADTIAAHVAVRLSALDVMDVITQADVESMIDFEALRTTLVDCTVADCLRDIGQSLGAELLVTGAVSRAGGETLVHLALVDLTRMGVLAREAVRGTDPVALLAGLDDGVLALVRPVLMGRTGHLAIASSEPGAEVMVDGKLIGTAPLGRLELPSGPHRVNVGKDGFFATALDVTVRPGSTVTANALLIPSQELVDSHRAFSWGVIGAGIGGVALGAGLIGGGAALWAYQYGVLFPSLTDGAPVDEKGVPLVAGEEYLVLWTLRATSYALMVGGFLPGVAGIVTLILAPDPGRYDALVGGE